MISQRRAHNAGRDHGIYQFMMNVRLSPMIIDRLHVPQKEYRHLRMTFYDRMPVHGERIRILPFPGIRPPCKRHRIRL